jgi:hypothetical protein
MEGVELVLGWGKVLFEALRLVLINKGMDNSTVAYMLADCLAPPLREMVFPRDL